MPLKAESPGHAPIVKSNELLPTEFRRRSAPEVFSSPPESIPTNPARQANLATAYRSEDERTSYNGPYQRPTSSYPYPHAAGNPAARQAAAALQAPEGPEVDGGGPGADEPVGLGIAFEQLDPCPEAGLPRSNLTVCGLADGSPAAECGAIQAPARPDHRPLNPLSVPAPAQHRTRHRAIALPCCCARPDFLPACAAGRCRRPARRPPIASAALGRLGHPPAPTGPPPRPAVWQVGDELVAVDEQPVEGLDGGDVAGLMLGPWGSTVRLRLRRAGRPGPPLAVALRRVWPHRPRAQRWIADSPATPTPTPRPQALSPAAAAAGGPGSRNC